MGERKAGRILFLGNSITRHGPAAEIGWSGDWGMAASARENDYVHVLVRAIAGTTGSQPEFLAENIADFERQWDSCEPRDRLRAGLAFHADIVVVAIGENVPALADEESREGFGKSLSRLLGVLKESGHPGLFVRSTFWPDPVKDAVMRQAAAAVGGAFVDISGLSRDESNYARSERTHAHDGVAAHPGDRGMQAIADLLLQAIESRGPKRRSRT
jgi:lysophospholipase L1-like esterase